jgi:RNA 2',3'-cyclic 3'-phosphodiesterase
MDRLFIAAWPDPDTSAALALLPRPDERGVRWSRPDQWHITLRFLGNCDRNQVAARLGDAVLPFARARLGPAIDWLGPQLVVPVAGVDELAAAVHAATDGIGDPPRPQFRDTSPSPGPAATRSRRCSAIRSRRSSRSARWHSSGAS